MLAVGGLGAFRYADTYWVYRGFPPPSEPTYVIARPNGRHDLQAHRVFVVRGKILKTNVWSASLGNRWISTYVFLPPGYSTHPFERYPVFYFLHGLHSPGFTYLTVLGGAVDEDVLVAEGRMKPMIVVIPSGPWHADTEWADGARTGAWDTFVARDLVDWIDAHYRTLRASQSRAIGGLSEGGYGALNIGIHHPRIFGVIQSWSGYSIADVTSGVFGKDQAQLASNSPLYSVASVAETLRVHHVFFWFYTGTADPFFRQNAAFASELTQLHIPHEFFTVDAGHLWRVWRRYMVPALVAASDHLSDVQA